MSATVKYAFTESRAGAGAAKRMGAGSAPRAPASEKVPRVARLLALAHKFQRMLDSGEVESMAELARLGRVSRARITQIMDLLMLAPDIQEEILASAQSRNSWGRVHRLSLAIEWRQQRAVWRTLRTAE